MASKVVDFFDMFSNEDLNIASSALATYNCKYVPVVLMAPSQISEGDYLSYRDEYGYHSASAKVCTTRLAYAIQVWLLAITTFNKRSAGNTKNIGSWLYYWTATDSQFMTVATHDKEYEKNVKKLWDRLQKIADSGFVKVSEGYRFYFPDSAKTAKVPQYEKLHIEILVDKESAEGNDFNRIEDLMKLPKVGTPLSYSWEEIKDLFVELSLKQISLLDPSKLNKHNPVDEELFAACEELDINKIKSAIQKGADVNSLDTNGEGALIKCMLVPSSYKKFTDREINLHTKRVLQIMEYLIEKGADVNLYGIGERSPIDTAVLTWNPELVKFLLNHGANPRKNYDTNQAYWNGGLYYDDIQSSSLEIADLCLFEFDGWGKERMEEIYDLLEENGARYYTEEYEAECEKAEQERHERYESNIAKMEEELKEKQAITKKNRKNHKNTRIKKWKL